MSDLFQYFICSCEKWHWQPLLLLSVYATSSTPLLILLYYNLSLFVNVTILFKGAELWYAHYSRKKEIQHCNIPNEHINARHRMCFLICKIVCCMKEKFNYLEWNSFRQDQRWGHLEYYRGKWSFGNKAFKFQIASKCFNVRNFSEDNARRILRVHFREKLGYPIT